MENRDYLIEGGLSTIEKKIEGLVKPIENYKFKTNCKYDELNLKTLSIPSLIAVLTDVDMHKSGLTRVFDNNATLDKSYKSEFRRYNFTIEEWESDILYLIGKQEYNTKLRDLQYKAERLKKYYSDDRQADIAVQDILDSI
jgi:hypothetical protein